MATFTDETKQELIKSFAYDYTAEQIAELEEITVEEANQFATENAKAIEAKKAALKEGGWLE